MSKLPYELRSDLLHLARNHLSEEVTNQITMRTERARASESVPDYSGISFPTIDEIIAAARKLNGFVSNG